jgi:hypothetical protein
MASISQVSIDDTLHLLQLVRETALARANQASGEGQAPAADKMNSLVSRLAPVVDGMKELRGTADASVSPVKAEAPAGILGQADFQLLLEARKTAAERSVQMAREAESGSKSSETIRTRTAQAFNAQAGQGALGVQMVQSASAASGAQSARPTATVGATQAAAASSAPSLASMLERNRMIQAMSSANMNEVEIARQFGMSREEVRLVLNLQQKSAGRNEVIR